MIKIGIIMTLFLTAPIVLIGILIEADKEHKRKNREL